MYIDACDVRGILRIKYFRKNDDTTWIERTAYYHNIVITSRR